MVKKAQPVDELNASKMNAAIKRLAGEISRESLASYLGKSFRGQRDVYESLGYSKALTFQDYMARFQRQDIAKAVINRPVDASWRLFPDVIELDDKDTEFEKQWGLLVKSLRLQSRFARVDRLASIGKYAVLLLGFNDNADLTTEVGKASKLLYVTPFSEPNAAIQEFETNPSNERYGLPIKYGLNVKQGGSGTVKSVHWSRVIHVAEDCLESEVEGTPQLEAVFNRLADIELISGGSAEMFWRGAFPGLALNVDPNFTLSDAAKTDLNDELLKYMHGMQRILRLQGITPEMLAPVVADPKGHVDMLVSLIAAGARIPQRILLGSERGELASSQDAENWQTRINERRTQHCEQVILRPFIDRLTTVGALPMPVKEYTVSWPDLFTPGAKEQADVALTLSQALSSYVNAIGADTLIPRDIFLKEILHFTDEQIDVIDQTLTEQIATGPEPLPGDQNAA